jgi:hypothetical protein
MPVEIRQAVVPSRRIAFVERPLDFVDSHLRGCFHHAVHPLLGVAYRSPGVHQPAKEIGSFDLLEIGVCHAPKPAADGEVATVRRTGSFRIR